MIYLEALQANVKVFSVKVGIAAEIDDIILIDNERDAAKKIIDFLQSNSLATAKVPYFIKDTIDVYCEKIFE
jgi:phosphopantothenoylcysteine synthetase/decarboxylase